MSTKYNRVQDGKKVLIFWNPTDKFRHGHQERKKHIDAMRNGTQGIAGPTLEPVVEHLRLTNLWPLFPVIQDFRPARLPCRSKKRLESGHGQWEFPRVKTLTVDDRQRIRLPKTKPGAVFAYEPNPDGTIKLVPVIPKPGPRRVVAKLIKRGGGLFFQVPTGYTLGPDAIGKAVAEEREDRS